MKPQVYVMVNLHLGLGYAFDKCCELSMLLQDLELSPGWLWLLFREMLSVRRFLDSWDRWLELVRRTLMTLLHDLLPLSLGIYWNVSTMSVFWWRWLITLENLLIVYVFTLNPVYSWLERPCCVWVRNSRTHSFNFW